MARVLATNYTATGTDFYRATADGDAFDRDDLNKLALAVDEHTHASTRGLPVTRLATGATAAGTLTVAGALTAQSTVAVTGAITGASTLRTTSDIRADTGIFRGAHASQSFIKFGETGSVANDAIYTITSVSGAVNTQAALVIVVNDAGGCGIFNFQHTPRAASILTGAALAATWKFSETVGTASCNNVYHDGTNFVIQNKTGGTRTYSIFAFVSI